MRFDEKLRSPKERALFILSFIFSAVIWLALIITVFGAIYGVFIAVFILMAHALFLAQIKGNGLRISEQQIPDLHQRVVEYSTRLGLAKAPDVYVLQAGGVINAFATKFLSRQFVIILSGLVEQCRDPEQLDFVIGHELGHFAAGHLKWKLFLAPAQIIPLLGAAYSRACEYTCDRIGLFLVGKTEPSMRGLCVLAAGGKLALQADLPAFMSQRRDTGGFWMAVLELVSTHPFLCKRAAALKEYTEPGTVAPVGRNPLAYPLAPFFGFAAGGSSSALLGIVIAMGILVAIAVPNFKKYLSLAGASTSRKSLSQPRAPGRPFDSRDGDANAPPEDEDSYDAEKVR